MRQSNSVGMNFCAISRSESSSQSSASAFSSAKLAAFLTPREKELSGNLQDEREAQRVGCDLQVGRAGDHDGGRHRHLVEGHQLVEIDLVGAADHRQRIVDDRHALLLGAAGKTVGVVGNRRGLADEERVVIGKLDQVAPGDRLDLDAHLLGDARPVAQRADAGGRQFLVGIHQRGKGVARGRAGLGVAPFAVGVGLQACQEARLLLRRQAPERVEADPVDRCPALALLDDDFERGRAEPVEQEFCKTIPRLGGTEAEEEGGLGRKRAAEILAALVERDFEFRQRILVEFRLGEIDHGFDGRDDLVAARAGEQRGIIARLWYA